MTQLPSTEKQVMHNAAHLVNCCKFTKNGAEKGAGLSMECSTKVILRTDNKILFVKDFLAILVCFK